MRMGRSWDRDCKTRHERNLHCKPCFMSHCIAYLTNSKCISASSLLALLMYI